MLASSPCKGLKGSSIAKWKQKLIELDDQYTANNNHDNFASLGIMMSFLSEQSEFTKTSERTIQHVYSIHHATSS